MRNAVSPIARGREPDAVGCSRVAGASANLAILSFPMRKGVWRHRKSIL